VRLQPCAVTAHSNSAPNCEWSAFGSSRRQLSAWSNYDPAIVARQECQPQQLALPSLSGHARRCTMTSQLAERKTPAPLPRGRGKGPGGQPQGLVPPPGQCPVPGCGDSIDTTRLMCRRDWKLLPRQLRDHVWETWHSGAPGHRRMPRRPVAGVEAAALPAPASSPDRIGMSNAGHTAAPA
jgi:hypothetical protein